MTALEIVGLEWLGALFLFLGFIGLVRYFSHRERMAMIARGIAPPPRLTLRFFNRPGSAALRGGLITAMVGFAVTIGSHALGYLLPPPFSAVPGKLGPWLLPGLIPLFVGMALVASHYLAQPHSPADAAPREGTPNTAEDAPPAEAHGGWRVLDRERDELSG
ncbi:MAG TPA: DUF6249 domain-containing protein [Ktedonobacterales bacterium]|nr:DUF6249 domain-containing protein [Ktedonobacterales bacterium]